MVSNGLWGHHPQAENFCFRDDILISLWPIFTKILLSSYFIYWHGSLLSSTLWTEYLHRGCCLRGVEGYSDCLSPFSVGPASGLLLSCFVILSLPLFFLNFANARLICISQQRHYFSTRSSLPVKTQSVSHGEQALPEKNLAPFLWNSGLALFQYRVSGRSPIQLCHLFLTV